MELRSKKRVASIPEIQNKRQKTQSPSKATKKETHIDSDSGMTLEEVALYDRQIRLWGMEAQNK